MAHFKDIPTLWAGLSVANQAALSITPAIAATYNFQGWSFTDGFNPLRDIDPVQASATKSARVLATFLMDFFQTKTPHSS